MRTFYQTLDEFITVKKSMDGNVHRVITYKGEQYTEPFYRARAWVDKGSIMGVENAQFQLPDCICIRQ